MPLRIFIGFVVLVVTAVSSAFDAVACDVCAIYTATEMREGRTGFRLGVAEQFSRFTTLKDDGEEIPNPGERLNSSITQLLFGYDFGNRFGLQLNLPIIARDFRRIEGDRLVNGNETGIGDMSLIGLVRPYSWVSENTVLRFSLIGGLKFPTGSSDRLNEELEEDHHAADAHRAFVDAHEGHDHGADPDDEGDGDDHEGGDLGPSGIHGHDLALGSGSFDGIIGGAVFASWTRLYVEAAVQYAIRTRGSIDYRYANDLTWSGGPGVFALLSHDYTLAFAANVTGEHKGKDDLDGVTAEDTGITAVYMGPGITFTWGTSLAADIEADFPLLQDNTSVQLVPDYRLRGGLSWRF